MAKKSREKRKGLMDLLVSQEWIASLEKRDSRSGLNRLRIPLIETLRRPKRVLTSQREET